MRRAHTIMVAGIGALGGLYYVFRRRKKRQFGGMDSLVSYSARVIAAQRAIESRKEHGIVKDPLAEALAGPEAMQAALQRMTGQNNVEGMQPGVQGINRLILRTLLVDDFVRLAVGAPFLLEAHRQRALQCKMLRGWVNSLEKHSNTCKQVVLLGAGMDTRAWRLAFPPEVNWFEVDVCEVIKTKKRVMEEAGASFAVEGGNPGAPSSNVLKPQCSSFSSVIANLEEAGCLSHGLKKQGFDTCAATAWVIEGLLYYLKPESVPNLLQETAAMSGDGSSMVASIVGEEMVQQIQEKTKKGSRSGPPNISSAFLWGCPRDPKKFFAENGWDVIDAPNWVEIAEEMGFKPEVGDQRNSDVTALGVGEPAVTPEPGVNNIVEARRARSSYLVACRA